MAVWSVVSTTDIVNNDRIDAEYYRPYLIEVENSVRKLECRTLGSLGRFITGPFGSAFHVNNYIKDKRYRYIRGKDVKPFIITDNDNVYLSETDYLRLSKYALSPNDIMISVVGTLGNVALIQEENTPSIFSCKSTALRTSFNQYFLLAYLNSKYGRDCLLRRERGAIQAGLNLDDIRTVPVPIFDDHNVEEISNLVRSALYLDKHSKELYSQAEKLLENILGLSEAGIKKEKIYECKVSDVIVERRANAEYFTPVAKQIMNLSCFKNYSKLGDLFYILRGKTPKKYEKIGIPVLKTKQVRIPTVDKNSIKDFVTNTSECIMPSNNDLVFASMGVGSLGRVSYIFEENNKFIIDGTLRVFRLKPENSENIIVPVMLFLTSKIGQELIYRGIVGSTGIISLPDDFIRKIPIPFIEPSVCEQLTNMVNESIRMDRESKELLEKAKRKVEDLIEEAVDNESVHG